MAIQRCFIDRDSISIDVVLHVRMSFAQVLCAVTAVDDTVDYYCAQNEENEDKNRYSQILPSKPFPAIYIGYN